MDMEQVCKKKLLDLSSFVDSGYSIDDEVNWKVFKDTYMNICNHLSDCINRLAPSEEKEEIMKTVQTVNTEYIGLHLHMICNVL